MMLTHLVRCLRSISPNRQLISGSKLDLLSFLNFPQGCVILLSNKHKCNSLSSLRVAGILESNCRWTWRPTESHCKVIKQVKGNCRTSHNIKYAKLLQCLCLRMQHNMCFFKLMFHCVYSDVWFHRTLKLQIKSILVICNALHFM